MPRLHDTVSVQLVDGGGVLDNFTSLTITNDLTSPSEASIEMGDDATFASVQDFVKLGKMYKVFVNNRLRLTGRIEADDSPADARGGSVTRFVIRTKLADAMFTTAEPAIKIKGVSVKRFILAVYERLGFTEKDFIFSPHVARDLLTGLDSTGRGKPTRIDLEPIKLDQAKIQANETIFDVVDRHLRRHGLIHWDSPDGKIVIGSPNDTQEPSYFLQYCRKSNMHLNNVISATRTQDWSGIPSAVVVHGRSGGAGHAKERITGFAKDAEVYDAGLDRPIIISADGIRQQALAERAAQRELSARSKNKDNFVLELDGLSFWDGYQGIEWGIDTTCSVNSDTANISGGVYYIHRVTLRRDAQQGDTTNLTALKKGVWLL